MSFDEFVALRLDPLLRYATVLTCDAHQAHDIVQEVMLRAQQRWSRIGALDAPAAYVKRMITNEFLSWRRRMSRREIAAPPATMTALGPTGADPAVGYTERDAMLARIAKLPRKQRAAIVLRYYDNCSDAEIAELIDCGQATVRSHISRALKTLRANDFAAEQTRLREAW